VLATADALIAARHRRGHWPFVARAPADAGYDGVVAMEAFAATPGVDGSELALERFRSAFTV
jgi:hydroxypyruvate isomerase